MYAKLSIWNTSDTFLSNVDSQKKKELQKKQNIFKNIFICVTQKKKFPFKSE